MADLTGVQQIRSQVDELVIMKGGHVQDSVNGGACHHEPPLDGGPPPQPLNLRLTVTTGAG